MVTADSGYAYSEVYAALERWGVAALIPAKKEPSQSRVPLRLFRYDARHDVVKCPRGKKQLPRRPAKGGVIIVRRRAIARAVNCVPIVCRRDGGAMWFWFRMRIRHCCARVGVTRAGGRRRVGCGAATCVAPRATTASRRTGTDWRGRCVADSRT